MRFFYLNLLVFISLLSACAAPPVHIQPAQPQVRGAIVFLDEAILGGNDAGFGSRIAVQERARRELRQVLQRQGFRVVTDPNSTYDASISIAVNIDRFKASSEQYSDSQTMTLVIELINDGEFLASGSSGQQSVYEDLERNHSGYRSLNHLARLAVSDLLSKRIARDLRRNNPALATTTPAPNTQQTPPQTALLSMSSAMPQPQSYALIIGVENYRDLPAPTGARHDAEAFARMVTQTMGLPSQNVRILLDQHATRSDILAQLRWLENNVSAGSRIYLYFSGHGSPETTSGTSYLLPYEASPESLQDTGLSLPDIVARLQATPAREVLAFVDACFSGNGGRSVLPEGIRPLVPVQPTRPPTKSRVAIFSASQATQISGNRIHHPVGVFTHYLIEGLGLAQADLNGDGQITLAELDDYVSPRVVREARQASREQLPSLYVANELGAPDNVILTWGISNEFTSSP